MNVSDTVFSTLCLAVTSNGIWLSVGMNIGKPSGLLGTYIGVMDEQLKVANYHSIGTSEIALFG